MVTAVKPCALAAALNSPSLAAVAPVMVVGFVPVNCCCANRASEYQSGKSPMFAPRSMSVPDCLSYLLRLSTSAIVGPLHGSPFTASRKVA